MADLLHGQAQPGSANPSQPQQPRGKLVLDPPVLHEGTPLVVIDVMSIPLSGVCDLRGVALATPAQDFARLAVQAKGPLGLVTGPASDEAIRFAGGLILRYSSPRHEGPYRVQVTEGEQVRVIEVQIEQRVEQAQTISMQYTPPLRTGKRGR